QDDRRAKTASQRIVLVLDKEKIAEPLAPASSVRGPGIRAGTPWWLLLARRLRPLLNGKDVWRDENRADPGQGRCAGTAVRLNAHATCSTHKNVDGSPFEQLNPVSREPYSNSSCPTAQSGIDYAWQFPSLVIRPRVRPTATRVALPGGIMSTVFRVGFAVCLLLVAAATSWAQDGVITGRIADRSGATLPGVDVSLTSPALLGARSVVSDEQGNYRFALLPPGVYSVRFQL